MGATFFSVDGARRVIDQTLRGERRTDSVSDASLGKQTGPLWAWVKVTGAGTSSTGWTGKVLLPITTNDLADETSDAIIYSAVPNELPDVPGGPYIARLSGWDDARSKSTWQALFVAKECCAGGGGVDQCTVPKPAACVACMVATVQLGGVIYTVPMPPDPANIFGCGYKGVLALSPTSGITVQTSMSDRGIYTYLDANNSTSWESLAWFNCVGWDGGCVNFGTSPKRSGSGGIVDLALISICPGNNCGGSGGGGGGDDGGGGGGVFCQPCDPAVDNPCFNCGNGKFCANAEACFNGPGKLSPMSSGGGCSSCGGTSPTATTSAAGGCGGSCSGSGLSESDVTDIVAAVAPATLAVHVADAANTGAGETDLYTDTLPANTLIDDDWSQRLQMTFLLKTGTSPTPRLYFGGILIFDVGFFAAGLADTPVVVNAIITRKSSTTARAVAWASSGTPYYTPESTLTGLDFTAAIILKSTGQGGSTNDIKAVQAITQTLPGPGGGSTVSEPTYAVPFLSGAIASIATSPGGYTGAGATPLVSGPTDTSGDFFIRITATAAVTDGNIVRVFVTRSGVVIPKFQFKLSRTPLDPNALFQLNLPVPKITLNGSGESISLSQEGSDSLMAEYEEKDYQV